MLSTSLSDDEVAPAPGQPETPGYPDSALLSHRRLLVVLGALMVGLFLAALDQTVVSTALPTISADLGGVDELSWIVTSYLLASTVSTPLYGKISDIYGRKALYRVAVVAFLLGSLGCAISQDIYQLAISRGVQGIGGGGLVALAFAMMADLLPPRERGKYQGAVAIVFAGTSVIGPFVGGLFVDHLTWRWIFIVNIPLGIATLVVTQIVLSSVPFTRVQHTIDYLGAVLLVVWMSALLLAAVSCGSSGWQARPTVEFAVVGLVTCIAFFAWERRQPEPILPTALFANRTVALSLGIGLCFGFTLTGSQAYLPVYLQISHGASATGSGLLLIPMMFAMLLASVTTGRLIARTGRYRIFPILGSVALTAGVCVLTTLTPHTPTLVIEIGVVGIGLSMGLVSQVLVMSAQNASDASQTGVVTASVTCVRSLGATFGAAVFGSVLSSGVTGRLPDKLAGPHGQTLDAQSVLGSPQAIAALPDATRTLVQDAFAHGASMIYVAALPTAIITAILAFSMRNQPLRSGAVSAARLRVEPTQAAVASEV
jgi:EmrB/QacA subfamily drug resistance transporter